MKKRNSIISLLFGLSLLLAMAVQSLDSFHHLEKLLTEKKCLHQTAHHKAEITHAHHGQEHCFVCEFAFGNAGGMPAFSFSFRQASLLTSYTFFHSREITHYFKGSLFALRAPPVFIV